MLEYSKIHSESYTFILRVWQTPCIAEYKIYAGLEKTIFFADCCWKNPFVCLFKGPVTDGYPSDGHLRQEQLDFDRQDFPLRQLKAHTVKIYFMNNEAEPTVVNEDVQAGTAHGMTPSYAENLLSYRYGRPVRVYVRIGGAGQDTPLMWEPPGDCDLLKLQKHIKIRFCWDKEQIENINRVFPQ